MSDTGSFNNSLPFTFKRHLVTEEDYKIRQLGLELFSIPFNKVNTECNYNLIDTCDWKQSCESSSMLQLKRPFHSLFITLPDRAYGYKERLHSVI